MTQYFTQRQIDDYRECFLLYAEDGMVTTSSQLRYIMRSLGYGATFSETTVYFKKKGGRIDLAGFLEILHEHAERGDPLVEITQAFRSLDKHRTGYISVGEFAAILTSIGEKMTRPEIEAVVRQLGVAGNRLPYEKLVRLLAKPPPLEHY